MLKTKAEFAEMCGISTSYLSVAIGRRNVVPNEDGMIDTEHPSNVAYYNKKVATKPELQVKKKITLDRPTGDQQIPREETYVAPKTYKVRPVYDEEINEISAEMPQKTLFDPDTLMSLPESEQRYKHNLAIKTERDAEIKRLEIEKKKGIVVPSAPIQPIFLQHNQHILAEMKNADEEMLTAFAHKYGISGADVAYIRGEWVNRRNVAMQKASEASAKGIAAIINDYSDKRAVGERER